jgi:integrase/recombinase XerC
LSTQEQERLLAVFDDAPDRDRVLFTLMLKSGIRVGSAVKLDIRDIDLETRELMLRSSKGNREERLPISSSVARMLAGHIGVRDRGPLFLGRGEGRLSERHAQRLFGCYATRAGLRSTRTHSLRHSYAMRIYHRTHDVLVVKRALGHRSVESTLAYARCEEGRLRALLET